MGTHTRACMLPDVHTTTEMHAQFNWNGLHRIIICSYLSLFSLQARGKIVTTVLNRHVVISNESNIFSSFIQLIHVGRYTSLCSLCVIYCFLCLEEIQDLSFKEADAQGKYSCSYLISTEDGSRFKPKILAHVTDVYLWKTRNIELTPESHRRSRGFVECRPVDNK